MVIVDGGHRWHWAHHMAYGAATAIAVMVLVALLSPGSIVAVNNDG